MPTEPPTALTPYLTTPDHRRLWEEAQTFAAEDVAARVESMEAAPNRIERDLPQLMAEAGWFGVTVPTHYGGMEAGHVAKTVLIHRIGVISAATAAILQASHIPTEAIKNWGTDDQKQQWLPQVADGTLLPSIAVTEPEAGGHIGGIETTAERHRDHWVINGIKAHIGNSHIAGVHVVIARTAAPGVTTSQALTAFLVEHDRKGVTLTPHCAGLGLHGFTAGRLHLDRVRIPAANVLGPVGQGLYVAQSSSILCGRPNLTAVSLGIHEALVQTTTDYLSTRPRYDGYLSEHPVVQDRIGAIQARYQTALTAAYSAVHLLDTGRSCDPELIGTKLTGHELLALSALDAMDLHGAYAVNGQALVQRLFRDSQHMHSPAGTGDFQRKYLAGTALGIPQIAWSERFAAEAAWTRPHPDPTPA
ncbi:acyl-CoA dehydrogenase family protein [Streptomyces sp. NPDC001073]